MNKITHYYTPYVIIEIANPLSTIGAAIFYSNRYNQLRPNVLPRLLMDINGLLGVHSYETNI